MPAKPEQIAAYSLLGIAFVALAGGFILLNLPVTPAPQPVRVASPNLSPVQASPKRHTRRRKMPRTHAARPKRVSEEEHYSHAQSIEVWAESQAHHYYLAGSPQYGSTRNGVYMSLEDAQRLGYARATE